MRVTSRTDWQIKSQTDHEAEAGMLFLVSVLLNSVTSLRNYPKKSSFKTNICNNHWCLIVCEYAAEQHVSPFWTEKVSSFHITHVTWSSSRLAMPQKQAQNVHLWNKCCALWLWSEANATAWELWQVDVITDGFIQVHHWSKSLLIFRL